MSKAIMIQGAGSNVGKSLLVAGLCRLARMRGMNVAPFKPQNMSNNAAVTGDGGEIGRAQALQARAAGLAPMIDMNPVLLKPESETGAQVIVHGKRFTTAKARDYARLKPQLLPEVLASFERLKSQFDLVIVEGAGSPAEVNLRQGDIANMGFAVAANCPVILAGDIDRGGVIAQLVGTHAVLDDRDREMIAGFLINKFRGDMGLFDGGRTMIAARTGWRDFGIAPFFDAAHQLPAEDAAEIAIKPSKGAIKIAVPRLSRIANFDDLDPLSLEADIQVEMVAPGNPLPADADLILIPGTKSTIGDLAFLRAQGWDIDIQAHLRQGKPVIGICGGYQMLGREIIDTDGIEGHAGTHPGLGHLDVITQMRPYKHLHQVQGLEISSGASVTGYEIHIGETEGPDCARPWIALDGKGAGAISPDGLVRGCYLHGIFGSDEMRRGLINSLGGAGEPLNYAHKIEETLDGLAKHLAAYLDCDAIFETAS